LENATLLYNGNIMVLFEIPGKFRVGYHCTMIARKAPSHIITEMRCWFIVCFSVYVCFGCRNHIVAAGHTCVLCDTREFSSASDVSSLMTQERVEAALAIHLFKGGRLLLGTSPLAS